MWTVSLSLKTSGKRESTTSQGNTLHSCVVPISGKLVLTSSLNLSLCSFSALLPVVAAGVRHNKSIVNYLTKVVMSQVFFLFSRINIPYSVLIRHDLKTIHHPDWPFPQLPTSYQNPGNGWLRTKPCSPTSRREREGLCYWPQKEGCPDCLDVEGEHLLLSPQRDFGPGLKAESWLHLVDLLFNWKHGSFPAQRCQC